VINFFSPSPVESVGRDSFPRNNSIQTLFLCRGDGLEEFVLGVPGVVYECDQNLSITKVSTNAAELLGVESASLLGSRGLWGDWLHPKDRITLLSQLDELQSGQGTAVIHRIVSELGLPLWVSHSFRKITRSTGEIIWGCVVPLPTDLCTHAVDGTIISHFVHKIGNHFQLINLLMGTLRRSGIGLDDIDALQQAIDRTVEFTRAFLNYAQIPNGQSDFELHEILKSLVQAFQATFDQKRVSLVSNFDESFNAAVVHGDPIGFERAVEAILQNALEATSAGDEVSVIGKCACDRSASRMTAQIVITDTGSGMQIESPCRWDEPFFTSRRDRDGLGLSTAVRIVEQQGGSLRIDSSKKQGTRVTIALPVSASGLDRTHYGAPNKKNR